MRVVALVVALFVALPVQAAECPMDRAVYVADQAPKGVRPDELRFPRADDPQIVMPLAVFTSTEMKQAFKLRMYATNGHGEVGVYGPVPAGRWFRDLDETVDISSPMWGLEDGPKVVMPFDRPAPKVLMFPLFHRYNVLSYMDMVSTGMRGMTFRFSRCE